VTDGHDSTFFEAFLEDYELFVYPFHPIITPAEAKAAITEIQHSLEARAFVYALVAVTINLASGNSNSGSNISVQVDHWITEAIKVQASVLTKGDFTVRRIITVQWMHVCLMGLRQFDLAFYYLRQSVSMVQVLRGSEFGSMALSGEVEKARRQRLYWEVFVHERFFAISRHEQAILLPLTHPPEPDVSIPYSVDCGFRQIIRLFLHIDPEFLTVWNNNATDRGHVPATWIEAKHRMIEAEHTDTGLEVAGLSDWQLADLVITKHWIHMLLWQIAVSQCMLSSTAREQSMSLLFPVRVSSQLRGIITRLSKETFMIHGTAMQQKLFEITDTIANVINTVPASSHEETKERISGFAFLVDFMFSLPRPDKVQKEVLSNKVELLRSRFPGELD